MLRDAWSLPSERDGRFCWLFLLGGGNLRGSEHEEYEVKIKMVQKKWLELNILTWKFLFSGGDKSLVRGRLLGENFSRWGEEMRKFVASGWDVWPPTAQQWKSLCGYTNYSHTLTYFLLTYPTYCRHATKMTSLCTTLGQTYLQTFKTYVRSCQSMFKMSTFMKKSCHKEII